MTMLDNEAIHLREEALAAGLVLDAMYYERCIIPWGSDCCRGCEYYDCGQTITAHGYCPIQGRKVSPHYFCGEYEQD